MSKLKIILENEKNIKFEKEYFVIFTTSLEKTKCLLKKRWKEIKEKNNELFENKN